MVYVDALRDWGWHRGPSCHMIADTSQELHSFALSIGLRRAWHQRRGIIGHYDLTRSKRALAVSKGAREVSDREFIARLKGQ